ncbi:hypothetical protein ABZ568_00300 [Streptomyces olindensis]|uniref:Uncharacterized protein n=1 Tax=Streptomyces olindensis TaxID=358823 RepID=A0ABV2XLM0_9ACTN
MSREGSTPERAGDVLVQSRQDQAAVRSWLLLSAQSADRAQKEWEDGGIALLKCGTRFTAVRIESELVHAAAASDEPEQVNAFLAEALGGPVFADRHARRYYALVPVSTASMSEWRDKRLPGAECLGRDSYLGVPRPAFGDPDVCWTHWCVPMVEPGALCDADAVSKLVASARHRLTVEEARSGS